jgi:uncharacterized protein (TIGR02391 family)
MPKKKLDFDLLDKMAEKSGKSKQYIREQISRRAGSQSVSSLSAQLIWAKGMGVGVTTALNRAGAEVRDEVRHGQAVPVHAIKLVSNGTVRPTHQKKAKVLGAAEINFVLSDDELRDRCKDLLLAKKHYDRVVREATTVFDDRLKNVSGIHNLNPVPLVGKALNPDPAKAVVVVSTDKDQQEGFFSICKGVMQAFRNNAHHRLSSAFTQADALKVCGFIDTILSVLMKGHVHPERI